MTNTAKGEYLLSIEPIPDVSAAPNSDFLAYYVGSTAPINVEDGIGLVENPKSHLQAIATFLVNHPDAREILIVVHGYNTSMGNFSPNPSGVKGWYESIKKHIAEHYFNQHQASPNSIKPSGLVMLGYRWSSEVINGVQNDSIKNKIGYAARSLPALLGLLFIAGIGGVLISIISILTKFYSALVLQIIFLSILILAVIAASIILVLVLLRLSGYFRDSYRANNYGVPDLVELIRQLDTYIVDASPGIPGASPEDDRAAKELYWKNKATKRIKLSFIGHSMGGFVVTNAVRVLSDVFDKESIGSFDALNKLKCPSPGIGNVFSLGRLVLVSPDIPAETIISGRANFLSSSLRRFEEAYLFSNEGDMALRLASTAANYFNFPARTRAGGYRLGNVVVCEDCPNPAIAKPQDIEKKPAGRPVESCGVVNLDAGGQLIGVQPREMADGKQVFETTKIAVEQTQTSEKQKARRNAIKGPISSFLNYLFIVRKQPLSIRQSELISADQKPIAELFTFFDCTDYQEVYPTRRNGKPKKIGVLTHALGKASLNEFDFARLAIDYFSNKIDTHGGYFNDGDAQDPKQAKSTWTKPEAKLTKQLIYGLACLGFADLLQYVVQTQMPTDVKAQSFQVVVEPQAIAPDVAYRKHVLLTFSDICRARGIQVLLAPERYNRDILGIWTDDDRIGY